LEALLIQHPAVKDVGVVGISDEKAGEVPLAFVVKQPNQSVSAEDLVRYVAGNSRIDVSYTLKLKISILENISVQKHLYGGVRFIEQLPKNSTGKTLKSKLKELL
jgi:4-coumarate--CoA ligase